MGILRFKKPKKALSTQEHNMKYQADGAPPGRIHTAGDFLVQVKNYVLLDCPCGIGDTNVTRDINKKLTKAQKEFLYDYLIKDGQDFLANHMFENW